MDPAKVEFLFDRVPDDLDLDDPDQRSDLVALDGDDPMSGARSAYGPSWPPGPRRPFWPCARRRTPRRSVSTWRPSTGPRSCAHARANPLSPVPPLWRSPTLGRRATVLDRHYRSDDGMWVEMFPISEDEEIVRATLRVEGNRLEVQTHSEPRLDRVLALLDEVLPDARRISDQRAPLAPGQLPHPPTLPSPAVTPGPEALAELQELIEQRWLDDSVPSLAGMTPRQAAADPTRRDELRRLIASFPADDGVPEGAFTMRPARLRELLGL